MNNSNKKILKCIISGMCAILFLNSTFAFNNNNNGNKGFLMLRN